MRKILEPPVFERAVNPPLQPFYLTKQARNKAKSARRSHRKMDTRPFCAWDGEGVTREDGVHVYTLLAFTICSAEGDVIKRGSIKALDPYHPLGTQQCFKFIMNVAAQNPKVNHVWFAFGYDVNMMLGDLPREELELLHERGGSWTYCPSIQTHVLYRPKKTLGLRSTLTNTKTGAKHRVSVSMSDTFTFFQTSFVKAVDTYLGTEWEDKALIIAGKSERATGFGSVDVAEYNYAELRTLCRTMNELRSRLAYVDIHPRDWHGPGAVASKLLQMHDVRSHTAELPHVIDYPLRHSYAGGRFELFRYGSTRQRCWRYDMRSAYPYAATQLPTAQGKWRHVKQDKIRALKPFALYRVEWHCEYENEKYPQPFHYRSQDGKICYPPHVQGWYWGCEVIQAQRLPYKQHLFIYEAYEFTPDYDAKPFSFMQSIYDQRRALIAEGHPAQLALKLAINSVYGKLIQQLGWSRNVDGTAKPPAYFNLFWASLITSQTRAALMKLVIDNEGYDDVISFETDAVFSSRQWSNVTISEKLGDWEEAPLDDLVYLQSGVYATSSSVSHVRGMTKIVWPPDPVATFRDMLAKRWEPYEYKLTAFVGLGTGLTQDMDKWRSWIEVSRKLQTMEPALGLNKRNHDPMSCACQDVDEDQVDIWHTTRVWPAVYWHGLQRAYDVEWYGPMREVFDPSELGEDIYAND